MTERVAHRSWRELFRHAHLAGDLAMYGCPVSLRHAVDTAYESPSPLQTWVRADLASGEMLRTAQAEHVASGRSLVETAQITLDGGSPDARIFEVIQILTRREIDERDWGQL